MESIIAFFSQFAPLIFLLLLIGLVIGIQRLVRARGDFRLANFGLEREIARQRATRAGVLLILTGCLAFIEIIIIIFLAPNLSAKSSVATATINPAMGLSNTLSPDQLELIGTTSPIIESTPESTGCIPGQIMITSPASGSEVKGKTSLQGSADIPNFGFYKYEFSLQGSDIWSTVQAGNKVINDGWLGDWDTSNISPGDYFLRLVVTDNQGNLLPACIISIRVKAP